MRILLLLLLAIPAQAGDSMLWPERLEPLPVLSAPAPLPSLSAQTCNACHGQIHDQWAQSGHAQSATNPAWLASKAALGDPPACQDCHLPLIQQRAELPRGPGGGGAAGRTANPAYEPTLALEGVTCVVCHVRDGIILGPRELPPEQAPHPVEQDEALRDARACAYCHQHALPGAEDTPFLDTVGEWERSAFGQAGIPCQDCHMQRVSGAIAGSRYAAFASHGGLNNRDPAALRRAVTLMLRIKKVRFERGDTVRASAELLNTGAGHAVPTGDPNIRVELRFELLGPAGKLAKNTEPTSHWLAREVQAEAPFAEISDDRLQPGASRTFDFGGELHKKQDPGTFTLRVSLHWWAMSPEQAQELKLGPEVVSVEFAEQQIRFEVN